jgi:hypothetical protein
MAEHRLPGSQAPPSRRHRSGRRRRREVVHGRRASARQLILRSINPSIHPSINQRPPTGQCTPKHRLPRAVPGGFKVWPSRGFAMFGFTAIRRPATQGHVFSRRVSRPSGGSVDSLHVVDKTPSRPCARHESRAKRPGAPAAHHQCAQGSPSLRLLPGSYCEARRALLLRCRSQMAPDERHTPCHDVIQGYCSNPTIWVSCRAIAACCVVDSDYISSPLLLRAQLVTTQSAA